MPNESQFSSLQSNGNLGTQYHFPVLPKSVKGKNRIVSPEFPDSPEGRRGRRPAVPHRGRSADARPDQRGAGVRRFRSGFERNGAKQGCVSCPARPPLRQTLQPRNVARYQRLLFGTGPSLDLGLATPCLDKRGEGFRVSPFNGRVALGCAAGLSFEVFAPAALQVRGGAGIEQPGTQPQHVKPCRHWTLVEWPFDPSTGSGSSTLRQAQGLRPFDKPRVFDPSTGPGSSTLRQAQGLRLTRYARSLRAIRLALALAEGHERARATRGRVEWLPG